MKNEYCALNLIERDTVVLIEDTDGPMLTVPYRCIETVATSRNPARQVAELTIGLNSGRAIVVRPVEALDVFLLGDDPLHYEVARAVAHSGTDVNLDTRIRAALRRRAPLLAEQGFEAAVRQIRNHVHDLSGPDPDGAVRVRDGFDGLTARIAGEAR